MGGTNKQCFICGKNVNTTPKVASATGHVSTEPVLDKNLEVIFLLRKVLEVPVSQLGKYLEGCPNAESWITVCDACFENVKMCRSVFEQLLEANRRWRKCKLELVGLIKDQGGEEGEEYNEQICDLELVLDISQNTRLFVKNRDYSLDENPNFTEQMELPCGINSLLSDVPVQIKMEVEDEESNAHEDVAMDSLDMDNKSISDSSSERNSSAESSDSDSDPVENAGSKPKSVPENELSSLTKMKKRKKKPSRQPINCHICNLKVSRSETLKHHLYTKHSIGGLKFQCDRCQKMFKDNWHLQRHTKNCSKKGNVSHSRSDEYLMPPGNHFRVRCAIPGCLLTWPTISAYRAHLKAEHTEKERSDLPKNPKILECVTCGELVSNREEAEFHWRSHDTTLKKEEICETCGVAFANQSLLNLHRRNSRQCKRLRSESEAKVKCDICGKRFSSRSCLTQHVRQQHEGTCKYRCEHCDEGFEVSAKFILHLAQAHQIGDVTELELKCPAVGCSRVFYHEADWEEHQLRAHSHEEPGFECEHCGKCFYVQHCLNQHVNVVHQGQQKKDVKNN